MPKQKQVAQIVQEYQSWPMRLLSTVLSSLSLRNLVKLLAFSSAARATAQYQPIVDKTDTIARDGMVYYSVSESAANMTNPVECKLTTVYPDPIYLTVATFTSPTYLRESSYKAGCLTDGMLCEGIDGKHCVDSGSKVLQVPVSVSASGVFFFTKSNTTRCHDAPHLEVKNLGCDYHDSKCKQGSDDVKITCSYV